MRLHKDVLGAPSANLQRTNEDNMLEALRKAAGTWVAKILLLLLVLSFAVWGISGSLVNGVNGGAIVTAGKTEVGATEYRLAWDRQLSLMSRQFGQQLSREQATSLGIDEQVLSQLVASAVLDEQARQMGLGLSQERLAALTAEDPAFHGPDGKFDRQRFAYVLQQVGMRPEDYFDSRSKVAMRQQIVDAATDGMKAPDAFLRAVALYQGEDRTIDYFVVPRTSVEPIQEPAAEALTAWFEPLKARYAAPEYRKINYVKLEPQDISDPAAVTDDQVNKDYEANKSRYTTPETRTIEQLVFPSMDAAKAAKESGKTFEQLMADQNKTASDVSLGSLAKDRVPDTAIAEAAFGLPVNQISDPIQGAFGALLVRVTAITPETVKPFAEVAGQIRNDIALGEANRILLDVHDSYEDARAGGETMQQAADKLKLKVQTVEADRKGLKTDGEAISGVPESAQLLAAAFETDPGTENAPLNLGSNGFLFYEVDSVTEARERTLDEVEAKAIEDWKLEQANALLETKVKDAIKKITDGASVDVVATELGATSQIKRGVKREADDADLGREGVAAVFGVAEGGVDQTPTPSGDGRVIFKVTEVFEPAGADAKAIPDATQKAFATGIASDMLDELVARLQGEFGVTVNREAAKQAMLLR